MIVAVLQARVSSSRLPGKVLKPILGVPMILRQIERIKRAKNIDKLIVATSTDKTDDQLAAICYENNIECFRGSLDDVLERFYQATKPFQPEHIVRLTGDCPLADHQVIDKVIDFHVAGHFDYTSNSLEPTYPDGLDVEVLRFPVLEHIRTAAALQSQREHVTLYIYQHPEQFKIGVVRNNVDLSALRWTVDEPQDFALVSHIYEHLYPKNPGFTTADILAYLANNPQYKTMNLMFERNEGLRKSLSHDR